MFTLIFQLDDHSRVALTIIDGDEYSDYINANFIHVRHLFTLSTYSNLFSSSFRAIIRKTNTSLHRDHLIIRLLISGG